MKILCRDHVIRGTTGRVLISAARGQSDHRSTVHMALRSDVPPEQVGRR